MSRPGLHKNKMQVVTSYFAAMEKADTTPKKLTLPTLAKHAHVKKSEQEVAGKKIDAFLQAYEEGFQKGLEAGLTEGRTKGSKEAFVAASEAASAARKAELDAFAESLKRVLASADSSMKNWYELAEAEVVNLTMDIVRKVLAEELKISRESVLSIAKEAMSEISHASTARIRVNPMDSPLMKSFSEEIKACAPSVREIQIVDDPTITGGCIIESDGGQIDASIDGKLSTFDEELGEAA